MDDDIVPSEEAQSPLDRDLARVAQELPSRQAGQGADAAEGLPETIGTLVMTREVAQHEPIQDVPATPASPGTPKTPRPDAFTLEEKGQLLLEAVRLLENCVSFVPDDETYGGLGPLGILTLIF